MQLRWTSAALADLDAVEVHITEDNRPVVALDVVFRILDTIDRILPEQPKAGRLGRVADTRELVIDSTPFIVVYQVSERVEILRVLHGSQQWPPEDL